MMMKTSLSKAFIQTIAATILLGAGIQTVNGFTCLHPKGCGYLANKKNNLNTFGLYVTKIQNSDFSSTASTSEDHDHIRSAGCGVSLVQSGDCRLFDPEEEGKLQGTGNLKDRLRKKDSYVFEAPPSYAGGVGDIVDVVTEPYGGIDEDVNVVEAQHWLEHLDKDMTTQTKIDPPVNFAKPQKPVTATVIAQAKIIGDDAPGDIRHIVMRLPHGFHYVEGQSLSVIPPGNDAKNKKHKPRLYSIASTRYGDIVDGSTVSLCVRRAEYYDPVTGLVDESKKGVCSNFLCDAEPGTQVQVAGPVGKTMLLPEDPSTDVIMVATGTGIAPFRAFLHRMFMENTTARHMFSGTAWLILGVPTTSGLLYKEEFDAMQENSISSESSGILKVNYAISREMKNLAGNKYYVQDVIAEQADEIFKRLDNGANMYFCGLKGMMPSILETLEQVANERGVDWGEMLKRLKANHQWHVEVY